MKFVTSIAVLALLFAVDAGAQTLEEKISAAMASEARTDAERERDRNRRPQETLEFFQLSDDMRVLELIPGGGWYTKILAPVMRENGELHVALGTDRVRDNIVPMDGFDHINVIEVDAELARTEPWGFRDVSGLDLGVTDIDLALTFRNMHNFSEQGRATINAAVFDALKPGGLYGVVDHTRRHMEPVTAENRRRADVVVIIKEVLDAGFELVDYSDLHYRPDDELRFEVGRKSVTGNSDRFTLLFRKPD